MIDAVIKGETHQQSFFRPVLMIVQSVQRRSVNAVVNPHRVIGPVELLVCLYGRFDRHGNSGCSLKTSCINTGCDIWITLYTPIPYQ